MYEPDDLKKIRDYEVYIRYEKIRVLCNRKSINKMRFLIRNLLDHIDQVLEE